MKSAFSLLAVLGGFAVSDALLRRVHRCPLCHQEVATPAAQKRIRRHKERNEIDKLASK